MKRKSVTSKDKLLIAGWTGRMGKEIAAVASEFGFDVVGGLDSKTPLLNAWLKANSKAGIPDVVIDFSLPVATGKLVAECAKNGVPYVSGVTGLSEKEAAALKKASKEIPVLHSANMSVGVQMLARALEALKGSDGFDVVIEEVHHRHKRDRPSGTALLLEKELQQRAGRKADEIVSLRGGGVLGEHRVIAISDSEKVIFEHVALNRAVFARGACRAARWLVGRGPGLYSLRDTLY